MFASILTIGVYLPHQLRSVKKWPKLTCLLECPDDSLVASESGNEGCWVKQVKVRWDHIHYMRDVMSIHGDTAVPMRPRGSRKPVHHHRHAGSSCRPSFFPEVKQF